MNEQPEDEPEPVTIEITIDASRAVDALQKAQASFMFAFHPDLREGTVRPDGIRLVHGRPMQCKDIPDEAFLDAVRRTPGTSSMNWRMRWNVHAVLEAQLGPIPENLLLAKARKLIASGKMGGCPCGCRGDWHLPDECDAMNCCHPE
ncbi:hypothetical protein [Streptomyces olivochromogenes]|uniref:Uncharacterized protein n=1 Tax=Streptomyces olivochromogenes TaxID=1963 RepID=A0A250VSX1_STROL|nr:hypothetical protein [Streptomyces olivochromogenes]KUN38252.1 hypothetical protein AQJ27_44940 [Streptomyces olivochromogenes]GAX57307.1 hypothetical protein SO3561_08877 [Streptomyces olivochromogenes]